MMQNKRGCISTSVKVSAFNFILMYRGLLPTVNLSSLFLHTSQMNFPNVHLTIMSLKVLLHTTPPAPFVSPGASNLVW